MIIDFVLLASNRRVAWRANCGALREIRHISGLSCWTRTIDDRRLASGHQALQNQLACIRLRSALLILVCLRRYLDSDTISTLALWQIVNRIRLIWDFHLIMFAILIERLLFRVLVEYFLFELMERVHL